MLSPTTENDDRSWKFAHYRRRETLTDYVMLSQFQPFAEHYTRQGEQWVLTEAAGLDAVLRLPSVGCDLPLSAVYERVEFAPDAEMPEEVVFMSRLELYRELYEYEKDCYEKMLGMIDSVPAASRSDARFQQAVSTAGHSVASRKKWLSRMKGETLPKEEKWAAQWYDEKCSFTALGPRFDDTARQWTDYLASLDEARLAQKFEFTEGEEHFSLPIEVQIIHLFGHASYHRGQAAVLVDQLGGEVPLIDYEDWWRATHKEAEEKETR